ncbi:Uncharacterised protein [Mycobacteroides abscessus subsp. abscessus]|nr:Uncharacterised protein [Mycobacteroides abscessus subsp. abscessus]
MRLPEKSSRSRLVVDGTTMSACLAIAVHTGSCTTTVSTRDSARRSLGRF